MPDDRQLFLNRRLQTALAVGCIVILCGCVLLIALLPNDADLYNRLYRNERPGKPESTTVFLLVFPVMLSAGCIAACSRARWFFGKGERQPKVEILAAAAFITFFLYAALYRMFIVYELYEVGTAYLFTWI